ncbi:MAG TPA: hypothetical protein VN660_05415 [Steroidobacteraceae bacterium]|nr:hypothetical protein [Steroidobacteraceae bacterium]
MRSRALLAGLLTLLSATAALADPAPFDLAGPNLLVKVTHAGKTLPISAVPNLSAGDKLWIRAALPENQSARYLMVAAFLRGSTNPPPSDWFFPCETWKRRCQHGMTVTVPAGAQQVLVFLAPKTSGDLKTLIGAVRGRPGAFVRASQDLNQATLDRSRLQAYLTALHQLDVSDQPDALKQAAPLLARSLSIKLEDKCLAKIPELQLPCLMANGDNLILNDGHSTSIVEALTTGPTSDLAMEASYTPQLSYGYYSPYIASVMDIVRILGSFGTAQYQYIPALATQFGDQISLSLNTPPSFHNPRSVLVASLPAVEPAQLPPLHAVDPKQMFCARKTSLVLPVEGAPLVFSTGYARDIALRLTGKDGKLIDLPARPDAEQGGLVVDTAKLSATDLGDSIHAALHGYWGFDDYEGPSFELVNAQARALSLVGSDDGSLIVGRESTVHLQAVSVGCIEDVMLKDPSGHELKAQWKTVKLNEVEVRLPLQEAKPGSLTLVVTQYGAKPQPLQLHAFSEAGRLDSFTIRAGETQGVLKGSRLDQVASLSMHGTQYLPGKLTSTQGADELQMIAQANATNPATSVAATTSVGSTAAAGDPPNPGRPASSLKEGESLTAHVTLKDGRVFDLDTLVVAPRPSVALIGKNVQLARATASSNIVLSAADELPQDATLTFSVRAQTPAQFGRDDQLEVATTDGSYSTTLNLANGGLTLEDAHVAVATLDPARAYGNSAFGPLQFRIVDDGVAGEWQPLATLVRLPMLRDLKCPASADLACKLSGANLFLIDSVSADAHFDHATQVPDGFPGDSLPVPHPSDGELYVKLRDDATVINAATLVAVALPPSPAELARQAAAGAAKAQAQAQAQPKADASEPAATSSAASAPELAAPSTQSANADSDTPATAAPSSVHSPDSAEAAGSAPPAAASAATSTVTPIITPAITPAVTPAASPPTAVAADVSGSAAVASTSARE